MPMSLVKAIRTTLYISALDAHKHLSQLKDAGEPNIFCDIIT